MRCFCCGLLSILLCLSVLPSTPGTAQEEYIVRLRNGMNLGPGLLSYTDSLSTTGFEKGGSENKSKSIQIMDDGLRLTYFNPAPNNFTFEKSNAAPLEEIILPSADEVARSGNPPSIQQILPATDFNKYGRRIFSFVSPRGTARVLQGITLLTPKYAKMEILNTQSKEKFVWDTRISTSSIPADKLEMILKQALGMESSGDWLRLVRFYTQAQRYQEARDIMAEALARYPNALAAQRSIVDQLDQFAANDRFEEIKLRKDAGQHVLAGTYLGAFPVQSLPLEAQVRLQTEKETVDARHQQILDVVAALKTHFSELPEPDQQAVGPLVDEILAEISPNTIARLADFNRLRTDPSIPNENKVAFAVSGWLLGSGFGIDNLAIVESLVRVRSMVVEYLSDANDNRRQQILGQLRGEEGAEPRTLSQLLQNLKPPIAPEPTKEGDPPGLHRLTAGTGEDAVPLVVQVPPEYDPNRKYPCILALPGLGDKPDLEIDAWCGVYSKLAYSYARSGYATRYGYIVVSPDWMQGQPTYQYTEKEKSRILRAMRHAMRRFGIDTDRVFVAGHFAGATAAWDLAGSHPDLWAGAVIVSPLADKYIVQYAENLKGRSPSEVPLGTYIVFGQLDGNRVSSKVGTAATEYLSSSLYDSMAIEYRGRGRGLFLDELPKIFEWMELSSHRRIRNIREINVKTMRGSDRFFYWIEAPALTANVAGNPYQFDPTAAGTIRATLLDPTVNGVNISRMPSQNKSAIVWLTPNMVDFSRKVVVNYGGRPRNYDVVPDIAVMLEDVRSRADRQHFFWQSISVP